MKVLGLDVGTKRIGVAKADSDIRIAVPHTTINVDGTEFDQIAHIAEVYNANHIVIGLPRNSKGEETAQSTYVREFAIKLQSFLPKAKIYFQDESLTSVEAEKRLNARHQKYQKGDIDAEAATIILQDFLEILARKDLKLLNQLKIDSPLLENRKKPNKAKKHTAIIVLGIVIALLGIGTFGSLLWYNLALQPASEEDLCECCGLHGDDYDETAKTCCCKTFIIKEGESVADIARNLKEEGLIKSSLAFRIYVNLNGYSSNLKSGKYAIAANMTVEDIVKNFVEGVVDNNVFTLTILPGETLADIKKRLMEVGYSAEEVDEAFNSVYDHPVFASKPADASLEGYIFGETYEFYIGETVENILMATFDQLYSVIEENNLEQKFAEHGLSLHEGIILASIIQKEAGGLSAEDKAIVAQIFYSRLESGLVLGSDVTVTYALNQIDPDREIYTDNQSALAIDSCYNTRLYSGLPCGPISNPGESSLIAVADPAGTSYLYFLTGDDGLMYYSSTESEHNSNIVQHCRELCNVSL